MEYLTITTYLIETFKVLLFASIVTVMVFIVGIFKQLYQASRRLRAGAEDLEGAVKRFVAPSSDLSRAVSHVKVGIQAAESLVSWFGARTKTNGETPHERA